VIRKSHLALSVFLPLAALAAGLCLPCPSTMAQGTDAKSSLIQQQSLQTDDQDPAAVTFSGKIVKSGNRFVLAGSDNLTTYQLDDQQRAQDFLNKSVKVTGSLDASTGTIRVRAIDPA
jgi:hypothetical protein